MLEKELEKSITHHAYCIIGDRGKSIELIEILADRHGITKSGNPDFFHDHYEVLTIDDARQLKSIHETKPISENGKKIFVISLNGITIEAQNALLKLLEEPASYAHFFIIIPRTNLLLPTVKSRLYIIKAEVSDFSDELRHEVKGFLSSPISKKLELAKKFSEDISKEKRTRQDAINFLNALEIEIKGKKGVIEGFKALEAIEKALKYLNDRSPSVKMLLDYVAVSM